MRRCGEPQFPLLEAQHHFCLHGDKFVGILVPNVGTLDAVVSQRHSHAHLHGEILGCLHAGGDNWLQAPELGKSETPAEVISVMGQPGREGSVTLLSSDWLWAAELMNICRGKRPPSAPLLCLHLISVQLTRLHPTTLPSLS